MSQGRGVAPIRSRVYVADLGYGEKPYLCVSNNARNRQLDSFLAVRITTSRKPELASVVTLGPDEPLAGSVLCDDVVVIYRDEIKRESGALSVQCMMRVAQGLRAAFAL